jgi:hypothetical protein
MPWSVNIFPGACREEHGDRLFETATQGSFGQRQHRREAGTGSETEDRRIDRGIADEGTVGPRDLDVFANIKRVVYPVAGDAAFGTGHLQHHSPSGRGALARSSRHAAAPAARGLPSMTYCPGQ